jgi:arginine deiminase
MRAVFKHHPLFGEDYIVLDLMEQQQKLRIDPTIALAWDYIIEGGNLLVLNEETIAIGVGRRTFQHSKRANRYAFELLVEALFNKDGAKKIQRVYLVNLPDLQGFIHLDTVFNMFGPRAAVVMPYIFGYPRGYDDVLKPLVKRLRQDMAIKKVDLSKLPTVDDFERAGRVEIYTRDLYDKTGRATRVNAESKYFLDQLVEDGLLDLNNVAWVGGNPEDHPNPIEHLRVALREQANQAGNVFTVKPFCSVAYHRNPHTLRALEATMERLSPSAHLERLPSNELVKGSGGPHCLTMPLLRPR